MLTGRLTRVAYSSRQPRIAQTQIRLWWISRAASPMSLPSTISMLFFVYLFPVCTGLCTRVNGKESKLSCKQYSNVMSV